MTCLMYPLTVGTTLFMINVYSIHEVYCQKYSEKLFCTQALLSPSKYRFQPCPLRRQIIESLDIKIKVFNMR